MLMKAKSRVHTKLKHILREIKEKAEPSAFDKRKKVYNIQYHYIEDCEYPSKVQRFLMVVGNPYWYNLILCIIFIEVLFVLHKPILGIKDSTNLLKRDILTIAFLMELFYAMDILFTIIVQYIVKIEFHNEAARPILVIVCEIIGMIPFRVFAINDLSQVLLEATPLFKCVRMFYYFYKSRIALSCGLKMRVIKFFCSIIIVESIVAWLYFVCTSVEGSYETYVQLFEVASAQIVGKGGIVSKQHRYSDSVLVHELPMSIGTLLVMFIILKPTLCDIISLQTMKYEDKFKYIYKVHFFETFVVRKYYCSPHGFKTIMLYLQNYWEERQGSIRTPSMDRSVATVFPHTLIMEMALDCTYEMFRHSQILRDIEIPIMRHLAPKINNRLFMKGEYVYAKRFDVDFMIYIHRGYIDVLSNENGDSGVITLSAGTVMGETSLIYPYKSPVNVRCQTVCEIFYIHRNDFLQIIRHYPETYKVVFNIVNNRMVLGKKLRNAKLNESNFDLLDEQVIWLKATLHRYKALDPTLKRYHLMKNIYLSPFLARLLRKQSPLLHTLRYMEMLSIKQRNDVNYDLVFVRSQCLWILKYDSPIYQVWDAIVAMLAFLIVLLQPYVVFNDYSPVLNIIILSSYVIFFIDLLLSLITPSSHASTATTLGEIFAERFRSVGFYLDLCSVLYFPMFGHALPFTGERWIFIFHAVKVWKVYRMMHKWETRFKLNLLLQKYCVFVFFFFIYVYTLGYILTMDGVTDDPFSDVGIQISTGVAFKIKSEPLKATILYAFINTFAVVFESLGVVSITSANYMKYIRKRRIYQTIQRLSVLRKRNPSSQLFKRLSSFLDTQINDNAAFTCAFNMHRFYSFPSYYSELLKSHIYWTALKDLEFFKLVPREVVKRVSATAVSFTFHRHAMILSYGSMYDVIYILIKGEAYSVYGDKYYRTLPYVPVNLLEVLYGFPCVANIVAVTEVTMVSFHYQSFLTLLHNYHYQELALVESIRMTKDTLCKSLSVILHGKQVYIKTLDTARRKKSFHVIRTSAIYEDSYEEYDYYVPFDRLYPFGFIRLFMMRKTVLPDGPFLFWWEVSRCIFGYITSVVFFIPPLSLQALDHPFTYVLIALDLCALADIYVRMHVGYYTPDGILITHPLYTAKNYIFKAFIMDLLGMLPIYLFVFSSPQYRIIFNIFHLLQLYRLIGFKMQYFYTNYQFDYIFIVLTIICPMNLITCIIYMADCYDWENEHNVGIACRTFLKPNPLGNYVTVSYFIMSTLTCSGTSSVVNLESVDTFILKLISICSFASTFLRIYVTAYLFGSYNKIFSGVYKMRDNIRRLINYLRKENVKPYLRKQFRIYYELYWRWLYRVNPYLMLHNTNPALRRDLMYCLYGEHMHASTALEDLPERLTNFYKNILYHAKPLIIPKNGYVLTVNDVQKYIYFVHKGSVDVVAANGTVIETIHDGAILGNLDNAEYSRQRVSFVTNTVTKLLYIEATLFYKLMVFFPEVERSFCSIKHRKLYYIHSQYVENQYQVHQRSWNPKGLRAAFHRYEMFYVLSWFHFIFSCCIGLTMELYQMAVGEMHLIFLALQYTFDAIHLVHQYLRFHVPYMTQEQEFVTHPVRIKARTMGKKRFWFKFYFCSLPFDLPLLIVVYFAQIPLEDVSLLFSILRMNRLLRWWNIGTVYYEGTLKVSSFSKSFKITMLFMLTLYSTLTIASIIAVTDYCYTRFLGRNESQIIREMPVEHLVNVRSANAIDKLVLYTRYWFLSTLLHTFTHDDLYYPKEDTFELLFIVIFIYVTLFESFVMVHYYKIVMESTTLGKIVYNVRKYIEVHYRISFGAYVLQENVEEAINHYYSIKSVYDDHLLHNCPRYLREATKMSIYGYLFKSHPYFQHCHPDMIRQMSAYMKCVYYPMNSTIVNRRDCIETLYFVHRGEVAAVHYDNDCTSNAEFVFRKGDSFGYEQAFRNKPFQFSCRTVTFCEIVELPWNKCTYLLDYFPLSTVTITKIMETGIKHRIAPYGKSDRVRRKRI